MTTSSGDFTNFCAEMNENRENTVASGRSSVFARRRVAAVGVDRNRVRNPTDATVGHTVARTPLEEETPKPLVGLTWFAIPRTRLFARSMSVGRSVAVECEARCNQSINQSIINPVQRFGSGWARVTYASVALHGLVNV